MSKLIFNGREVEFFSKSNRIKQKDKKASKFNRVNKLAEVWTKIEPEIVEDIKTGSKEAYAIYLLCKTGIRVGNEGSAEGYTAVVKGHEGEFVQTFGASTLKKEHILFYDNHIILDFVGKKVVSQFITSDDKILIEYGHKFYEESSTDLWLNITDKSIKKYLKKNIGKIFTTKDFRTLAANYTAFCIYEDFIKDKELPLKKVDLSKEIKLIVTKTSEFLGNTPGICKSAYLSNHLLDYITEQRNKLVLIDIQNREQKKIDKEENRKKINEDRIAQGLKPIRRKRRDLKTKRMNQARKQLVRTLRKMLKNKKV